jgi:SAM-dependent methyltransferase
MTRDFPEQFFQRQDESADENFYIQPRFVTHIDDATISRLTEFYREQIASKSRVLDLMSSWISHLPKGVTYAHVAGLGMNMAELDANPQLNNYCVQDLNITPALPYADNSFDAVLIAVSIQYLVKPVEVMTEINRCLNPGGQCIVAMSHRLFPTKAIRAFQILPPAERCEIVATYMKKSGLTAIEALDRSPQTGDPLWIVRGYSG